MTVKVGHATAKEGRDASFKVGRDASFKVGREASFKVGREASFKVFARQGVISDLRVFELLHYRPMRTGSSAD